MKKLIFLFCLMLSFFAQAQRITRILPVPYSTRVPSNVPKAADSRLWFNTTNSKLYGFDWDTQEWAPYSKEAAYGEISISNDTSTLSYAGTTPAAIGGLTSGPLSDFSITNDSTLTYDGAAAGLFRISYTASISFGEAGIMTGYVKVGSTILYRTRFRQTVTTATTERLNVMGSCLYTLNPGDIIRVVFAPGTHTGTDVLTVYELNLNLEQVN